MISLLRILIFFFGALVACDGPGPSSESLLTWSLAEELRVGSFDDPETALSDIEAIAVDPEGTAYVAQQLDGEIAVFGGSGNRIGTIGRKGEGPGEFGRISTLGLSHDSLWVCDPGNGRVTLFGPGGEIVREVRFVHEPTVVDGVLWMTAVPSVVFSDGSIGGLVGTMGSDIANGRVTHFPLLHFSQQSQVLDTIGWLDWQRNNIAFVTESSATYFKNPFSDHTLLDPLPDGSGVVLVERSQRPGSEESGALVSKISPSGDTISAWRFPYPNNPLSDGLGEQLIGRELSDALNHLKDLGQDFSVEALAEHLPRFVPPITDVAATIEGGVWLRREIELGDSVWWEYVSPEGQRVARIRTPASLKIYSANKHHVWGSELGLGDIPYLVRYRIQERPHEDLAVQRMEL